MLICSQSGLAGSAIDKKEKVFVHPIFWSGPSYYKRNKCEEIIRQVFINSGKYEYLGSKEYNKLLKQYPDYFNCTKLYCIYEMAHHLNADYVTVLHFNEMFNHYNVRIKIYDTDSMKVRYLKKFVIHESDPTLIDSIKTAFYKWNGKKYRPKTEIYDKFYELLWTRWNILQYDIKNFLTKIKVTSEPTNQKTIPPNVVKQSEPVTIKKIQHSAPPRINKSGQKAEESVSTSSQTLLYINGGFIEPWGNPGTGTLFNIGKRIQSGVQLNIGNWIKLPIIFQPLTAEVMIGYGKWNIKPDFTGVYVNGKTNVISVLVLGRYDFTDLIMKVVGFEYPVLGIFSVAGLQYNTQSWDFPNWMREFDSASSLGLNLGIGIKYNLQSLVGKLVYVDLRFTQSVFIMGNVTDQNGDSFFLDSDYLHTENSLLLGIGYSFKI